MAHLDFCQPSRIRFDGSDWPILRVTIPRPGPTTAELREYLDNLSAVWARREPFGLLIDALHVQPLEAAQRQLIADQMRLDGRRFPGVVRGLAVCLTGALARGGFTAINWLARPPYPTAAFESVAKANVWLTQRLGLPTSPHTRQRLATR